MEGGYTPQRHALIIGVNYAGTDWGELTGQLDATRFQRFLLGESYRAINITCPGN